MVRVSEEHTAYGGGAGAEGYDYRVARKEMADKIGHPIATRTERSAAADRSVNKALNSKAYVGDLLQDIENGSAKLGSIKDEDLPSDLKELSAEERRMRLKSESPSAVRFANRSCLFQSNALSTSPRNRRNATAERKMVLM